MWSLKIFGILTVLIFASYSCQETKKEEKKPNWSKERSYRLNKEIAEQEIIDVKLYCERIPGANFIETGTGLLYWVKKEGLGPKANVGDIVQLEYKITLLDGTLCYETAADEYYEFRVDKSDVETGIQEGVKYLSANSEAKLIISSYLAHGLTGDMDKIPPLTPIVVDLKVLNIKSKR
jgi:FKBP-type peptidyl-prolyl cis-trans isomerase FkpA